MENGNATKDVSILKDKKRSFDGLWKIIVFIVLWFGFTNIYLARKPFGIIKSSIQDTFNITEDNLGYMDLSFSLPYSLVSIMFGSIGDRIGARIILSGGLVGTALICLPIGYVTSYLQLLGHIFICGVCQSLTWPAACTILSWWFPQENKMIIFGIFNSSPLVGSIVSSIITVYILDIYGWRYVFWIPSITCLIAGIMSIFIIRKPTAVKSGKNDCVLDAHVSSGVDEIGNKKGLHIWQVLCLPLVGELCIMLFCVKMARNAIIFWLPYYLQKILNYTTSDAGLVALAVDVGGIFGTVFLSVLISKMFKGRDIFTAIFTNLLSGSFILILAFSSGLGRTLQIIILVIFGIFIASSDFIAGGPAPTRVGEWHKAQTSVLSVVNGIGSIGGIIEGVLIAYVSNYYGMQSVTFIIAGFCFLASLISIRAEMVNKKLTKRN